ncbi:MULTISPECIES: glycosyltransferase [unclassified Acinetobacter]|uniref:glycosyltransferase n=1 Tax=unclassified Acinetobacter TaxID=196816 RepID=UPI002577E4CD|nr:MULTISPECIES: glycosyltransferase [unclassified Acinetobacter]MDM1765538.1 glycosyltransferase [Acinetobacter sp. 226-1]MDM1769130.1 glycosyltransferase [Acinetobacter sp. 226-4]
MKIVLLSGASSIHTIRWSNALANKNVDVHLISQHEPLEDLNPKVKFYKLPYKGMLGYYIHASKVRKLISIIKPDLVNVHYASGYATLARLAKCYPTILSVWGSDVYDFPMKSFLHKSVVVKNLKYADRVASTSLAMAEQTNSLLSKKLDNIAITPFGVDFSQFQDIHYKLDSNEILIGTIKGLEDKYGIDILIKAFALLTERLEKQKSERQIFLEIVGEGPKENHLKALVKELNLEDKIKFSGRIEHKFVPKKLETFDIFAALSRVESFGVAVVEAHAARRPVIVSNVGGLPEVVTNGINGFVVECEDINNTCDMLEKLVIDYSLRKSMGDAGFQNALEKYSWNVNVDMMINLYSETLKKVKVK